MRFTSFHLVSIGLLLTAALQSSCSARTSEPPVQSASVTPAARASVSSDDEELLRDVERFASSDEPMSRWQSLQRRSRSELIEDLTRISKAAADDRTRVLIAFTLCTLRHEYAANREIVLSALSRNSSFKNLGDWAVSLVRRLMIQGDNELLIQLFDASEWSDGAMSTELAHAYSQGLAAKPEHFLRALSSRPEQTRTRVLALLKDNTLSEEERSKLRSYLRDVSRQSKWRPVAKQTLDALTN